MSTEKKVYGLILPKKPGQVKARAAAVSSVFGEDSDEDEGPAGPIAPYKFATASTKMKRQTQMDIDKALKEDPDIYEYDEVYDQMQASKPQVGCKETKTKADKKPKYVLDLLKAAEQKKKENERRTERKVQKEREAEGAKFSDKEKFVTSAYKKKMLEMQAEEERERREAQFEAMTDVTRQSDMSGFYRYLYRNTGRTGEDTQAVKPEAGTDIKQEPSAVPDIKLEAPSPPRHTEKPAISRSESPQSSPENTKVEFSKSSRAHAASNLRRKRKDSSSSASEEERSSRKSRPRKRQISRSPSNSGDDRGRKSKSPISPKRGKNESLSLRGKSKSSARRGSRSRSRSPQRNKRRDSRSRSPQINKKRSQRSRSPQNVNRRQRSPSPSRGGEGDRKRRASRSNSPRLHGREKNGDSRRGGKRSSSTARPDSPIGLPRKESRRERDSEQVDRRADRDDENNSAVDSHKSGSTLSDSVKGVDKNLKDLREASGRAKDKDQSSKVVEKPKPVDRAKKVYPHHNSAEDIAEARKRYLQRKIARERAKLG